MIIEVQNLKQEYKTYHRGHTFKETIKSFFKRDKKIVEALKDISFNIDKGEIIGFIGPNGAGKSTTIKILTGLLYPTSGRVKVLGFTPWKDRKKYVSNIGAVFGQKVQLLWDIPPIDTYFLNQVIYSIPLNDYKKKLNSMAEMLDISSLIYKPTRELSLGERMKCEFILANLHNPKILFLDEPTIGLDIIAKENIRNFIKEINKDGVTIMLTTHDLNDIELLATRVIVINNGEILYNSSMKNIRKYFGNKKIIRLRTEKQVKEINTKGIEILKKTVDNQVNLELDLTKISINKFINIINKNNIILDLSVQELPIDRIIKRFYHNK